MPISSHLLKSHKFYAGVGLALWSCLYFAPWQTWLEQWYWLRIVMGMALFILPGFLLALLFSRKQGNASFLANVMTGLMVSIFITGLLGLAARAGGFSFAFIRVAFYMAGLLGFALLFLQRIPSGDPGSQPPGWLDLLFISVVILAGILLALFSAPPPIHDDGFTYNALIYYYLHTPNIDFNFPVGLLRLTVPRFWIAYWPLTEALISDLSGMDGLLTTGLYLPPVLAFVSVLSVADLGRRLKMHWGAVAVAAAAQVFAFLRLAGTDQPGNLFFHRMTEDKVVAAFVFAPIFLALVVDLFEKPSGRRFVLLAAASLALLFTHPIIYGMACMVAGVYSLPAFFNKNTRLVFVAVLFLLGLVAVIPYSFRFISPDYYQSLSATMGDVVESGEVDRLRVGRVSAIEGTSFYGISLSLLDALPYRIFLAAVCLAAFFFRCDALARFILAAGLVLGLGVLPYTGWLIGLFVTPYMLWRLSWLTPFGLAFAFLCQVLVEKLLPRFAWKERLRSFVMPLGYAGLTVLAAAGVLYVLPWARANLYSSDMDLQGYYLDYINAGEALNRLPFDGIPVAIGGPDADTNSILPSLTVKMTPYVFRVEEKGGHQERWQKLVGEGVPVAERYQGLLEQDIQYLLSRKNTPWLRELHTAYPDQVVILYENRRLVLYQVLP